MVKVRAKHNVNIDGVWHMGGEIFETDHIEDIREHVDEVGFVSAVFPPETQELPKKQTRGRPRSKNKN